MMSKFVRAALLIVIALSACKGASAQMVLYDNFDTTVINPAKWVGSPGDPLILDELRELAAVPGVPKAKQFHLMERVYGVTTDNSGSTGGLFGLSFINPSAITAVSFTLVANTITQVACKTNPGIAVTGPEFIGSFFSMDPSPAGSSDDVIAVIDIEQNVCCGGPRVAGWVAEQNGTMLGWQVLGTVALKSTNTLFLQWDQSHHQFIFQLNNDAQVFEPYTVSDTSAPFYAFKSFDIGRVVADCTSTPRPYSVVDADFRDVYVNQ